MIAPVEINAVLKADEGPEEEEQETAEEGAAVAPPPPFLIFLTTFRTESRGAPCSSRDFFGSRRVTPSNESE